MSRLLFNPATWPALALNPEPFGTGIDPDSVERLYQEWMAPCPKQGVPAPHNVTQEVPTPGNVQQEVPAPNNAQQRAILSPARYLNPPTSRHLNNFFGHQ